MIAVLCAVGKNIWNSTDRNLERNIAQHQVMEKLLCWTKFLVPGWHISQKSEFWYDKVSASDATSIPGCNRKSDGSQVAHRGSISDIDLDNNSFQEITNHKITNRVPKYPKLTLTTKAFRKLQITKSGQYISNSNASFGFGVLCLSALVSFLCTLSTG